MRAGISTFARLSPTELQAGIAHLRSDLDSGAWQLLHDASLSEASSDLGYRLLIGR